MKLQFSLATLLAVTTGLAVDLSLAMSIPVTDTYWVCSAPSANPKPGDDKVTMTGPPSDSDIRSRMLLYVPMSTAIAVIGSWSIRRLKSRRHTECRAGKMLGMRFTLRELLLATAIVALGLGGMRLAEMVAHSRSINRLQYFMLLLICSLGLIIGGPVWLFTRSKRRT